MKNTTRSIEEVNRNTAQSHGFQKKNKQKDLFSILIVVDDFADDPLICKILKHSSRLIYSWKT